jgi:hypothetical protein
MDFSDNTTFIVKDLKGFIDSSRALVFNNFGKDPKEDIDILDVSIDPKERHEIDDILSFDESETICKELLKKQKNKKTKDIRYLINDLIFLKIIESLNDRMVSNILNGLVNKGLVETAYDDESNDFVFWIKDDNNNQQKKPETD